MFPQALSESKSQLWDVADRDDPAGCRVRRSPVFGAPQVPVQVRLIISLAVGIPALATGAVHPAGRWDRQRRRHRAGDRRGAGRAGARLCGADRLSAALLGR
jgi:hypothetical protein